MQWTKARLTGLSVIDLPLVGAKATDRFVLKEIDFGTPTVAVVKGDIPSGGSILQNRRPDDKQIVITMMLNADYAAGVTVSDLRTLGYGMLTPGSGDIVTLQIMNGTTVVAQTRGWVSKLEPNPFSKDPQLILTLETNSPYLVSPTVVHAPTPNYGDTTFTVNNVGNAPTGVVFDVKFVQPYANFYIKSTALNQQIKANFNFLQGDHFVFSTVEGNKYARVIRGASTLDILENLDVTSKFFQLYGGVNTFSMFPSLNAVSFLEGDIYFYPTYWGV